MERLLISTLDQTYMLEVRFHFWKTFLEFILDGPLDHLLPRQLVLGWQAAKEINNYNGIKLKTLGIADRVDRCTRILANKQLEFFSVCLRHR